jgi:hypothetical protein
MTLATKTRKGKATGCKQKGKRPLHEGAYELEATSKYHSENKGSTASFTERAQAFSSPLEPEESL